jgi:hypothetical protein
MSKEAVVEEEGGEEEDEREEFHDLPTVQTMHHAIEKEELIKAFENSCQYL